MEHCSFNELARGIVSDQQNMLNNDNISYVESCFGTAMLLVVSEYQKLYAEQIRKWVRNYICLGTDGFGRSDTREKLREFLKLMLTI